MAVRCPSWSSSDQCNRPSAGGGGDDLQIGRDRVRAGFESVDQFGDRAGPLRIVVVPGTVGLQPDPLRPAVVVLVDGRELARPVAGEAEPLELSSEVFDGGPGGFGRMDAGLDRILLGGQAEGVPSHRMEDVASRHPLVSRHDVVRDVVQQVSDVEAGARGVGEHSHAVVARLRLVEVWITGIRSPEDVLLAPPVLPLRLDGLGQGCRVAVGGAGFGRGAHGGLGAGSIGPESIEFPTSTRFESLRMRRSGSAASGGTPDAPSSRPRGRRIRSRRSDRPDWPRWRRSRGPA